MSKPPHAASHSNFIRQVIEADIASGKHIRIRTRFPPEPNGYLHLGHSKSILLNFGLAKEYGGACNLRFDDTNPEKEEQEYVDSIIDSVKWLGADYGGKALYASDYFDKMYECAEHLITSGNAYVDSQTPDEMKKNRGDFTHPGVDSIYRNRTKEENLTLFREMRDGKHVDGRHVLRAKIDMQSHNMNLRDPAIYRIKTATHHRTGDKWCIYPMYTYAHPIEDAIERITHSLCTLEFEDQRPFYDWLLNKLADGGQLERPLPQQIEFARLQLTHVLLSKRLLIKLVEDGHVSGWDDPRMPTIAGARRRGYTPEGFQMLAERVGVSKENSWIDYSILEDCMRKHLDDIAPRRMAVLDPIKLVIENYPEDKEELMDVPNHPKHTEMGKRQVPFSRELWIERDDYTDAPAKGYFRLAPGAMVRLRYGYVVKCEGWHNGIVRCTYLPETRSGTPGADSVKVKGNIHWVSVKHAHAAQVHLYDRLFKTEHPKGEEDLNPESVKTVTAQLEPSLRHADKNAVQFERHGYFISDQGTFNRTVTLRDAWAKSQKEVVNITYATGQPATPTNLSDVKPGALEIKALPADKRYAVVVKEYLARARELSNSTFAHSLEHIPTYLKSPEIMATVTECLEGVVVRYERNSQYAGRVLSAKLDMPLPDAVAMLSDFYVTCGPNQFTKRPDFKYPTIQLQAGDSRTSEFTTLTELPIVHSFDLNLVRGMHIPPPRKPVCVAIGNSIVVELAGETIEQGKPGKPFVSASALRLNVAWEAIEIFPYPRPNEWIKQNAVVWAERDISAHIVAATQRIQRMNQIDPLLGFRNHYAKLLRSFKELLDRGPQREEELQQFLTQNPQLLCPEHDHFWPKLPLGKRVTDYVFRYPNKTYLLVELERSTEPFMSKDDHPLKNLNAAIDQIRDWRRYIGDNVTYVRSELGLDGITANPHALVVIGRSSHLSVDARKYLAQIESESPNLRVMTYDDIYSWARAAVENLAGPIWDSGPSTDVLFPKGVGESIKKLQ